MDDQTYSFDVHRLGFDFVPKSSTTIASIQKPLKKLYVSYQKAISTNPRLSVVRLNANKRGLSVDSILNTSEEQNTTFMNEALITDNQVFFRAALTFSSIATGKKSPKFKGAFVNLNQEARDKSDKEYNSLFSSLDEKENCLVQMEHPPLFVCVNKTRISKNLELRVFVCTTNEQALDLMKAVKGEGIADYSNKSYVKNTDGDSEAPGSKNSSMTGKPSSDTASNNDQYNTNAMPQQPNNNFYPPNSQLNNNPYEAFPQQPYNVYDQVPHYHQQIPQQMPQQMPQHPYPNQAYSNNSCYPYPPYGNAYTQQPFMQPYQQQQGYVVPPHHPQNQYNQSSQPAPFNANSQENNDIMNLANLKFPRPTIDQKLVENNAQKVVNSPANTDTSNHKPIENTLANQPIQSNNNILHENPKNEDMVNEKIILSAQASQMPPPTKPTPKEVPELVVQSTPPLYPQLSPPIQQLSPTTPPSVKPPSARNSQVENTQRIPMPGQATSPTNEMIPQRRERVVPAVPTKKPTIPPPLQRPSYTSSSTSDDRFSPNQIMDGKESLHLIKPKKFMGVPVLPFPVNLGKTNSTVERKNNDVERNMQQMNIKKDDQVNPQVAEVEKALGYVP